MSRSGGKIDGAAGVDAVKYIADVTVGVEA